MSVHHEALLLQLPAMASLQEEEEEEERKGVCASIYIYIYSKCMRVYVVIDMPIFLLMSPKTN
jgi:hypothetical protein